MLTFHHHVGFRVCLHRHEAMSDVIALMGALVDSRGRILVPGVLDKVKRVSEDELSTYSSIDFDLVSGWCGGRPSKRLSHDRLWAF